MTADKIPVALFGLKSTALLELYSTSFGKGPGNEVGPYFARFLKKNQAYF